MVDLQTRIEAGLVIKQVEIDRSVQDKVDKLTRLRLGIGPGFAPSQSQLAATASAMGKAGIGGQSGLMGLAGSLGALLTSITGLTAIIGVAISHSKIITMFTSTIAKALGLLVDVILMPFMPLISMILVAVFKGIMEFYRWWKSIITPDVINAIKNIGNVLKAGLKGLFDLTLGAAITAGQEIWGVLKWIYEFMTGGEGAITIPIDLIEGLPLPDWIKNLLIGEKDEEGKRNGGIVKFGIELAQATSPFIWMWAIAKYIFTGDSTTLIKQIDFWINIKATGDVWAAEAAGMIGGAVRGVAGFLGIPSDYQMGWSKEQPNYRSGQPAYNPTRLQSGGRIAETGFAVVHKGETVLPAGGGITVNITGQFKSDEDMYRRFVDRLRQEQWRTNV